MAGWRKKTDKGIEFVNISMLPTPKKIVKLYKCRLIS